VAKFAPSAEQLVLLARLAEHIAVPIHALGTADIETDIATTLNLIVLAKEGLIVYALGEQVVAYTMVGRGWVRAHENWQVGAREQVGRGH
jgi:hypothetical protein